MSAQIPFLYLPDAISLAFIVIALLLLRRLAVEHFRQELLKIRNKLVLYCCDVGFPLHHPACLHIHDEITLLGRIAERISPANLYYVRRVCMEAFKDNPLEVFSLATDPFGERRDKIENERIAEKLLITQLEIDLTLGSLYLLGSLSGWIISARILYKIAFRKVAAHPRGKLDKRMDLAERFISRIGYRTLVLIAINTKANQILLSSPSSS
jgi:hypothetical protein